MADNIHPLAQLAKDTVEGYLRDGKRVQTPAAQVPEMQEKAGVFVCLKKDGELRGCIGTFMPTTDNVASETIQNAISAATEDPRFGRVRPDELGHIKYTVDVLGTPEPVKNIKQLDPKKYGVIVMNGDRRGLLLPDLEGVDTVEYQLSIAKHKAGIEPHEPITVYRFEVKRYE